MAKPRDSCESRGFLCLWGHSALRRGIHEMEVKEKSGIAIAASSMKIQNGGMFFLY